MKKRILSVLFTVFSILVSSGAWSWGTIYKCKNADGGFSYQKSPCNEADAAVSSWTPKLPAAPAESENEAEKAKTDDKPAVLTLKQNAGGHYRTDGKINDKALNFVVDTGASFVTLPEEVAHSALIYCDDKIKVDTANGVTDSCTAKIGKLEFGPFIIKDVPALIQPNLSQPLLGMNVLMHFKIEQNNDGMNISYLEKTKPEKNQ